MINSMTGYGQAEGTLSKQGNSVLCEVKTVNHRFCEVVCKIPRVLFPYEDRIKAIVRGHLVRGYITVRISMDEGEDSLGALEIDYDYAKNYHRLLRKLKKDLGLTGEVDVSLFIQRPGVIKETREKAISEKNWRKIKSTIEAALSEVKASREREGRRLLADMKRRVKHIGSVAGKIERKSPRTVQAMKKRLKKKISELDDSAYGRLRIEEEVAIFAQRCDVVEECVRLRSHLKSLEAAFQEDGAVGRRLVFLLQEMNREANTIASKAQDAEVSQHAVAIKEELERLREQAENVV